MSSWKEETLSHDNPLRHLSGPKRRSELVVDDLEDAFHSSVPAALSDRNLLAHQGNVQGLPEEDEITISLLHGDDGRDAQRHDGSVKERLRALMAPYMKRESLVLLAYLVCLVLIGTSNRVTFKLMQYATVNYSYFISQLTTFVYLPVNFAVVLFKLLFTNDITPEQRSFPWYKFLVMGTLDSLQGLLIVVGGVKVPGIMQNLLMQGAVPVTMLFSIFLLRNRGCLKCLEVKKVLSQHNVAFTEIPSACECTPSLCGLTVDIAGHNIAQAHHYTADDVLRERDGVLFDGFLQRDALASVKVNSSAMAWGQHFRTYYTFWQYVGACFVLAGLVVSVWPAFQAGSTSGGPPLWDIVFFSSNIPTALSGVYKEIAFRSCEDMDVWWLNAWVALWQFTIGLSYAPLAAVMQNPPLPIDQIPLNMAQGFECVFEAKSTVKQNYSIPACLNATVFCNTSLPKNAKSDSIAASFSSFFSSSSSSSSASAFSSPFLNHFLNPVQEEREEHAYYYPSAFFKNASGPSNLTAANCTCSCAVDCGSTAYDMCCDSCAGQFPTVSNLPAWAATLMYMCFNIAYNVFLLLVIKHGSAALMYIASTLVLPLGSAAFTIKAFMGVHATPFNVYTGVGLGVILLGLIIYRFLGSRSRPTNTADLADAALGNIVFTITESPPEPILHRPKTSREVRNRYYASLNIQPEVKPPGFR